MSGRSEALGVMRSMRQRDLLLQRPGGSHLLCYWQRPGGSHLYGRKAWLKQREGKGKQEEDGWIRILIALFGALLERVLRGDAEGARED